MIEDILILEEQDSDHSLVVVAVSGGEPLLVLAVVARGIQELLVLKALVLLVAGEGLTVDALVRIDWETWSSIKVLFFSSQILQTRCYQYEIFRTTLILRLYVL